MINRSAASRHRVAVQRDDEIRYLGARYGLSREQAEDLIEQHGTDRARLDSAARKLAD